MGELSRYRSAETAVTTKIPSTFSQRVSVLIERVRKVRADPLGLADSGVIACAEVVYS